jgi:sialate O-acetylesterase
MNHKKIAAILLTIICVAGLAWADLSAAGVFKDHMVLQRHRPVPVWGKAAAGQEVTVKLAGQEKKTMAGADGRWSIGLDPVQAGGPHTMVIKAAGQTVEFKDVYVGEVWLCSGQSNMDMTVAKEDRYWCGVINEEQEVAAADYPLIRMFDVPFVTRDEPQADVEGKWEICSPQTVGHFSAAAYFFARDLHQKLNVPIGLVVSSFGASTAEAWTSRPALNAEPELRFLLDDYAKKCEAYDSGKAQTDYQANLAKWQQESETAKAEGKRAPRKPGEPRNPHTDQHSPCVLYNGMIAPLVPYAIRGAIWYQGESNGPTRGVYDLIMETMVRNWRQAWGQGQFPFLYVQLANYGSPSDQPCKGGGTTELRDRQLRNLSIPNTAMATAVDIGDAKDIHPKNKQEVGRRLALAARNRVYGQEVIFSGPIYDYMLIEGSSVRLHFTHVGGGLKARDGKLDGFAIAGPDGKFIWGQAEIDGDCVVVSSPAISKPTAVRYGWNDNPTISLYNAEGLPASPFKTDQ